MSTEEVSVFEYGDGTYGQGYYGGGTNINNITDIVDNWPSQAIDVHSQPLYDWLSVLVSEYYRLDVEINELYENRFVETAQGVELEKLGKPVDIERRYGESDSSLRRRVRAGFARATSTTDFKIFAQITSTVLGTDTSNITLNRGSDFPNSPTVEVVVPDTVVNEDFNESDAKTYLEEAVPVGHTVDVTVQGTFAFQTSDGSTLTGAGFGDGKFRTE